MKTSMIVSIIILGVGLYIEYNKDSSLTSVDIGSVLIGVGGGALVGGLL